MSFLKFPPFFGGTPKKWQFSTIHHIHFWSKNGQTWFKNGQNGRNCQNFKNGNDYCSVVKLSTAKIIIHVAHRWLQKIKSYLHAFWTKLEKGHFLKSPKNGKKLVVKLFSYFFSKVSKSKVLHWNFQSFWLISGFSVASWKLVGHFFWDTLYNYTHASPQYY